jgi:Protein of unknown function (DUF1778)
MLESACREAQAVLLDQRYFVVSEPQYKRFLEVLDRPAQRNPKLAKLLNLKALGPNDCLIALSVRPNDCVSITISQFLIVVNRLSTIGYESMPCGMKKPGPPAPTLFA